jgi:hypothetical protein
MSDFAKAVDQHGSHPAIVQCACARRLRARARASTL